MPARSPVAPPPLVLSRLTIDRRRFLKGAALAGLAAPWVARGTARASDRIVKIGFVSPETGPIAAFGEADAFVIDGARKALSSGIEIAGRMHPVEIVVKDSQSNPNRASEVTRDLIDRDKVDIVVASSTSDTTNPVADQCEVNGVPCITTDTPWQAHFFGRRGDPATGFEWTYHFFWGLEDAIATYSNMWTKLPTNKVVGALWSDDPDGNAFGNPERGLPPALKEKGFTVVDAGVFTPFSDNFSSQIGAFKAAGVEILTGVFLPPDFGVFWTQAAQQGFRPKIATVAKALLFPSAIEALGERGAGLSTEVWWSPTYPFKSGITGQTGATFAAEFEKATGKVWTQPMGFKHAVLEVACDAMRRTADIDDPASIRDAIAATDYESIVGRISWKTGPVKNVAKTPMTGGQWRMTDGRPDLVVVDNSTAPEIPVGGSLEALPA
jgi:branched-chain amino acid transport system substrate-binding protein